MYPKQPGALFFIAHLGVPMYPPSSFVDPNGIQLVFSIGILGDEISHKYPRVYRTYIGISHRGTLGTSNNPLKNIENVPYQNVVGC